MPKTGTSASISYNIGPCAGGLRNDEFDNLMSNNFRILEGVEKGIGTDFMFYGILGF
ncbi:hypothetical protein JCM10914A_54910 [Paenibacillus sp. JCM 10914]